ncbi:MAG: alpha/beta hydrolase [Kiritimatiellae bacterium]|nr:alpha/beta hydrolase [Kiritimatiellia bacterium]
MKRQCVIACAGMMAVAACGQNIRYVDKVAAQLKPDRNVVYKNVGQRALSLHVFNPEGFKDGDRRPAFVTFHGGGWSGRSAEYFYPYADEFAQRGMVGVSVEYRLLNKKQGITVFDCVKDARSAIRFIRANARMLGIDPERIVVSGGSAGGHLAAATALFDDVNDPQDDLSVSCRPDLLVLYYPVIDTSAEGYGQKKIGERWRELSPVDHVKPGLPPTLLLHGTKDTVTPIAGAERFRRAMLSAGNVCELITQEGGVHGYFIYEKEPFDAAMRQTLEFIRRYSSRGK